MARLNTFHLPPEQWNPPYVLDGPEARHLVKVLRAGPGAKIRLIDGQGRVGLFVVRETSKSKAELELLEEKFCEVPTGRLTLAMGWNKSSRRNWILEKAVELEAHELVFWQAEFSQGRVPAESKASWNERFVTAAKQCGNPWLPQVSTLPGGVADLLELGKKHDHNVVLYEGEQGHVFSPPDAERNILLIIGPEGGFSPGEIDSLKQGGFAMAGLGRSILRWETAALLTLGMVYLNRQQHLGHGGGTELPPITDFLDEDRT
jgi:16S rRNA (uracil1498-N3)-methyltransferase